MRRDRGFVRPISSGCAPAWRNRRWAASSRCRSATPSSEPARTVGLWLAQTPQMFRLGALIEALEAHPAVTDEAAAIERAGHAPWLVEGGRENFKVTTAEDLELMQRLLERR